MLVYLAQIGNNGFRYLAGNLPLGMEDLEKSFGKISFGKMRHNLHTYES